MENAVVRMVAGGKTARNALVAVFALVVGAAMPSFAADWTDANSVTYTALESINGNGSGLIVTDFTPAGTEIVKFKYKPLTVSGNGMCILFALLFWWQSTSAILRISYCQEFSL